MNPLPVGAPMLLFATLCLALLNLLVGVAAALTWDWYSLPEGTPKNLPRRSRRSTNWPRVLRHNDKRASDASSSSFGQSPEVIQEVVECVPAQWIEVLEKHAYHARSFVEATAQVLRLKLMDYRQQLIEIEQRVKQPVSSEAPLDLEAVMAELIAVNGKWLKAQSEAMGALLDSSVENDALADIACQLEDTLLKKNAQIETSRVRLENAYEANQLNVSTIGAEIQTILATAHRLRDLMHQSLTGILVAEQRFDDYQEAWLGDPLCELPHRSGLEVLVHQWRHTPRGRKRTHSLVLFDIDGFARINLEHGTQRADQLLAAVCGRLNDHMRKTRGWNRLGRYSGQQLLAVLGRTGPEKGMKLAERYRKLVAAEPFVIEGQSIKVTLTAALVALSGGESFTAATGRLERELLQIKANRGVGEGEARPALAKQVA